jgi:hypothetical protein
MPLPFSAQTDNPLGLPLAVRQLEHPTRSGKNSPQLAFPDFLPKPPLTHGLFRIDGFRVASLGYGFDASLADRMVDTMNAISLLRQNWDFECIEQIPLIAFHAERLFKVCEEFLDSTNVSLSFVQRRLRAADKSGWRGITKDFLSALRRRPRASKDEILKGKFRHEYFSKFRGYIPEVSRIVCVPKGSEEKKSAFIISGYDAACPQAQRLYGEVLASTLQAFLNLNPGNPKLPAQFVKMTQALQSAVPEILSQIGTIEVKGISRSSLLQPLQIIKYYAEQLQRSLAVYTATSDYMSYIVRSSDLVDGACELHHQILAGTRDYIHSLNKAGVPDIPGPREVFTALHLRAG